MFRIGGRWHNHPDLEDAILGLAKQVSSMRLEIATFRAKFAVNAREAKKKTGIDAEIRMIEEQLNGQAVAYKDEGGKFHLPGEETNE
jgi:hypothetical protein